MKNADELITIFTDGSCHTQRRIGGWVAILFAGNEKTVISGSAHDATNNQMELTAVIEGVRYACSHFPGAAGIRVFSDSQYVAGLSGRKQKLAGSDFRTRGGSDVRNVGLVKELLALQEQFSVEIVKIKAHQKKGPQSNYNIEADHLARKIVRELAAIPDTLPD